MTVKECAGIMAILETAYPTYYAKRDDRQKQEAARLYAEMFKDDDGNLVYAAVKSIIVGSDSPFPPSIGEIKNKMHGITNQNELGEGEAWAMVAKAIRSASKDAAKSFECFPPVVQRIVHSPAQLRIWGQMESETVHSVIASNFMRSYKAIAAKEREYEKLPADVKALVSGLKMVQKSLPD